MFFGVGVSAASQFVPTKFGVWGGCVSNAPQTFQSWCFIPPKIQCAVELARCCLISQSSFLFCWMPQPFLELLPQGDRQPQFLECSKSFSLECSKSCGLAIGRRLGCPMGLFRVRVESCGPSFPRISTYNETWLLEGSLSIVFFLTVIVLCLCLFFTQAACS